MGAAPVLLLLDGNCGYVLHGLRMTRCNTVMPLIFRSSYGTHLLDHLTADGAGFAGGEVTVVAVGQVNADLGGCLHLELVHCFARLGDIQLVIVVVAHNRSLLFKHFSGNSADFRRNRLPFRNPSMTRVDSSMNGD